MAKRKHSFKEKWGSFRNFAKGEPLCAFMGDNYIEKTNIMDRREWRGFVDTAYDFGWWLCTWGKMSGLVMRDPIRMVRAFWRYRWLSGYLCTPAMVDSLAAGNFAVHQLFQFILQKRIPARQPRRIFKIARIYAFDFHRDIAPVQRQPRAAIPRHAQNHTPFPAFPLIFALFHCP